MKTLEKYTSEEREDFAKELAEKIRKEFAVETTEEGTVYKSELQHTKFRCLYTDEEMLDICRCAFELIEKLKEKIDNGVTGESLEEDVRANSPDGHVDPDSTPLGVLSRMHALMDQDMWKLYFDTAKTVRVGGAYLMLMSGPMFQSAIYSSFDVMLRYVNEQPPYIEDPELYTAYFLARAAMKMHSEEIKETELEKEDEGKTKSEN